MEADPRALGLPLIILDSVPPTGGAPRALVWAALMKSVDLIHFHNCVQQLYESEALRAEGINIVRGDRYDSIRERLYSAYETLIKDNQR